MKSDLHKLGLWKRRKLKCIA